MLHLALQHRNECIYTALETGVHQTQFDCFGATHWQSTLGDAPGAFITNSFWQQIGPVLRAVQIPHILVVWIEDDTRTGPDEIRCPGQKDTAGTGASLQRRHG